MIVYAVYIILPDGTPVYSQTFQSENVVPNSILLSALLTALQSFANEMAHSEMKTIEVKGMSFHFMNFDLYNVVLVTDIPVTPSEILHGLGLRFMKKFGDYLVSNSIEMRDLNLYSSFQADILDLLGNEIDQSSSINPTKKLTTAELFNMSEELRKVAMAMLTLEKCTLEELQQELDVSSSAIEEPLNQLIEQGYLGKKLVDDVEIFFCSIE